MSAIAIAVVATALSTVFIAGVFLYFYQKFLLAQHHRRHKDSAKSVLQEPGVNLGYIKKVGGNNVKGLIVEENGVDVIYMMDTESSRQLITGFPNTIFNPSYEDDDHEEEKRIDVMVHRPKISYPQEIIPLPCESPCFIKQVPQRSPRQHLSHNSSELASSLPLPLPPLPKPSPMILEKKIQSPPSPPPPPPPPSPPRREIPKAPPLPSSPTMYREGASPPPGPPPLPKSSGFTSSMKPPPAPKGKTNIKNIKEVGESSNGKGTAQTRLKPLHWDKVVANVDHSTVWDQINDGSFR